MIETGILFGDYHSFYDLNLILSKEAISPAKAKTTYIDIPGADGSVDASEVHGEVKYSDRECKFTLTMHPLDPLTWEEKKTEICNLLSGRVFNITLDKDSEYYYKGRCEVSEFLSDKKLRQFVITAKVHPYKFKQNVTTIKTELTETPKTIILVNDRRSVSPSIYCTDDDTVIAFGEGTYNLSAGTHNILDIQLKEGNNPVTVSGSGTITFSYQEGAL